MLYLSQGAATDCIHVSEIYLNIEADKFAFLLTKAIIILRMGVANLNTRKFEISFKWMNVLFLRIFYMKRWF